MIIAIIIIVGLLAVWYFFFYREKQKTTGVIEPGKESVAELDNTDLIQATVFSDADGREFYIKTTTIQIPRKTYIRGTISGKFRGELIIGEQQRYNSKDYGFEIYEAEISCSEVRKDIPFTSSGEVFPREKLPDVLPVVLLQNETCYELNILEPELFSFQSDRKLHQTDGHEVFGTFKGEITGYILDYVTEYKDEIVYVEEDNIHEPQILFEPAVLEVSDIETGRKERKGDYQRIEYFATNQIDRMWGPWSYAGNTASNASGGCLSSGFGLIGLILGGLFLIFMLPSISYFLLAMVFIFALHYLGSVLKWIIRIFAVIFLIGFVFSISNGFGSSQTVRNTTPGIIETPREKEESRVAVVREMPSDQDQKIVEYDTIIKKFRTWTDYSGNKYEGYYTLRLNDVKKSHRFKNNLQLNTTTPKTYDNVVSNLKEQDRLRLDGLYHLFDSIQTASKLERISFAKMVVSFVQDIPYALILQESCNSKANYNDSFIREYLNSPGAKCMGNQRFGINTPTEFLATQYGDCDTRSLLLYTVLSHYGYDVAMMSSEIYGHSILGVNLPIPGAKYSYNNHNYVVWETTALVEPGKLPVNYSNLNNWRISLKSK